MAAPGDEGRFRSDLEDDVAARIADAVICHRARFAYGSLASGGDILWAEALLRSGCELHVVLPFALEEFVVTSVAPAGGGWIDRFERCLEEAASISYATVDAYLGDEVLYKYCSELAMGLSLLRARYLDADVCQLALWDGESPTRIAGTARDVARWRATGHATVVVRPLGSTTVELPDPVPEVPRPQQLGQSRSGRPRRAIRAMVFGDVRGFSALTDEQLPTFSSLVMGAFASVLAKHDAIEHRNTWGDAVFMVLSAAPVAARCALDLQDAMAGLDLESAGLPVHLALRLSAHVGPVFPIEDPVSEVDSFIGTHINRTARIEPVTPPGAVYVSEAFAAGLELSGCDDIACDYVGHMPAAKDYGRLRMYRIRRRDAGGGRAPRPAARGA